MARAPRNTERNERPPAPGYEDIFPSSEHESGRGLVAGGGGTTDLPKAVSRPLSSSTTEETAGEALTLAGSNSASLIHAANHHDDSDALIRTEHTNRVQSGQVPEINGPAIGDPTKANPLGHRFPASLED